MQCHFTLDKSNPLTLGSGAVVRRWDHESRICTHYSTRVSTHISQFNVAEGKKAGKKRMKKQRANPDHLEFTSVNQTVRRFVHPDDLFSSSSSVKTANTNNRHV